MGALAGQIAGDDITRLLVDAQVKLAIVPVFRRTAQLADVNRETTAVDQDVDRYLGPVLDEGHFTQFGLAPRYRRVVRHSIVQIQ